jgi:OOP family OmpA-OmpF porin
MELSRQRAEGVKNYLVEKFSIDPERLIVKGVGSSEPIADNGTLEGQLKNRRVMIQDCP